MKNLFLSLVFVVITIVIPSKSFAQKDSANWKLNSASFLTGETPLLKGNSGMFVFSKGVKSVLVIDVNNELGEFMYFYYPVKQFSIGPSTGFLKNSPWFGPVGTIELFNGRLKTLNWFGWSFGNPEEGTTTKDLEFLFSYHQLSLIHKGFEAYYVLQNYQKNPTEHIFGLKTTLKINKNFTTFSGLGYMLHAEKFLWSLGINYNLK